MSTWDFPSLGLNNMVSHATKERLKPTTKIGKFALLSATIREGQVLSI